MKEKEQIEGIIKALDVQEQYNKALDFLKDKVNLDKVVFDGFYGHHLDLEQQINKFKFDYSGNDLVIFALSLPENYKFKTIDPEGNSIETLPPDQQEKYYQEGKTARFTNFYSVDFLNKVSNAVNIPVKVFEFGNTIIHLAVFYFQEAKPQEQPTEPEAPAAPIIDKKKKGVK